MQFHQQLCFSFNTCFYFTVNLETFVTLVQSLNTKQIHGSFSKYIGHLDFDFCTYVYTFCLTYISPFILFILMGSNEMLDNNPLPTICNCIFPLFNHLYFWKLKILMWSHFLMFVFVICELSIKKFYFILIFCYF